MDMKDPVCGMEVNKENSTITKEWQGEQYAFCSQNVMILFQLILKNTLN